MEFLEGRIFRDPSLPDVPAEERAAYFQSMVEVLAAMHRFDWRKGGLDGYGKPGG